MFNHIFNNQALDKQPFFMKYPSYSRLFVVLVLFDFIITIASSGALFFRLPVFFNTLSNIFYLLLFFIFSSLILYRFYNSFFEKKYLFSISGFIMMFIGIAAMYLKRYISYPLLQQVIYILFFMSIIFLYFVILIPVIRNKYINDFQRGSYVFLLLILVLPIVNAILKSIITSHAIIDIESYLSKLSSVSFLIFIFYYFFTVKKNVINMPSKNYTLTALLITIASFAVLSIFFGDLVYRIVATVFNNMNVRLFLPFYVYVFAMAILIITFLVGIIFADKTIPFIPLTLIILTGLNTTDFYIRIVSVFAVIDISDYISYIAKPQSDIIEKNL